MKKAKLKKEITYMLDIVKVSIIRKYWIFLTKQTGKGFDLKSNPRNFTEKDCVILQRIYDYLFIRKNKHNLPDLQSDIVQENQTQSNGIDFTLTYIISEKKEMFLKKKGYYIFLDSDFPEEELEYEGNLCYEVVFVNKIESLFTKKKENEFWKIFNSFED